MLLQLDEQILLTCLKHICWEHREASGQALHAFMRMLQHDKLHLEDIMNMQVSHVCAVGSRWTRTVLVPLSRVPLMCNGLCLLACIAWGWQWPLWADATFSLL